MYRLRSRAAPTRRAHRDAQTPHLCEFRLAVEFSLAIHFIIAPVNSSVARFRISLSSGISMFARGSETRGVWLNSVVLCRAWSRIPNQSKRIRLTAIVGSLCVEMEITSDLVFFRQRTWKRFINLNQINRRGHSNYTTKAYAKSRPKTHRAHILCSTTTDYAKLRD